MQGGSNSIDSVFGFQAAFQETWNTIQWALLKNRQVERQVESQVERRVERQVKALLDDSALPDDFSLPDDDDFSIL